MHRLFTSSYNFATYKLVATLACQLPKLKTTDNQEVLRVCISVLALARTPTRLHGKGLQQDVGLAAW